MKAFCATALLGFALGSAPDLAGDLTFRIGAGHPKSLTYVGVADDCFVPEVVKRAKEAGHNVRFIKAYPGTVAKLDGIVEAVQNGTLDMGLAAVSFDTERAALLARSMSPARRESRHARRNAELHPLQSHSA